MLPFPTPFPPSYRGDPCGTSYKYYMSITAPHYSLPLDTAPRDCFFSFMAVVEGSSVSEQWDHGVQEASNVFLLSLTTSVTHDYMTPLDRYSLQTYTYSTGVDLC